MALTIELTSQQESRLREQAERAGLTPETLSREVIEDVASTSPAGLVFMVFLIAMFMNHSPLSQEQQELFQAMTQPLIDRVLKDGTDTEIAALLPKWQEENVVGEGSSAHGLPALETHDGTVYVGGTGIKVRLLAEETRLGYTVEDLRQAHPQLTLAQIHAALAYYYAHQRQMDVDIEQRTQHVDEWRAGSAQPAREQLEERLRRQGYQITPDGLKKSA